ncbi:hypothetical protein [Stenotrophomonas phage BUCT608]|nr:hypothetical protein [Stenotrophomonas phage BUCT608]QYC97478.1 hypothetical protein [Stenotrophomonas phage BUCT608]
MFKISQESLDELQYKVAIAIDEPDLQESYGVTEDDLLSFEHKLDRDQREFMMNEKEFQFTYGELSNSLDQNHDNWKLSGCTDSKKFYQKLKRTINDLEKYGEAHGYEKGE